MPDSIHDFEGRPLRACPHCGRLTRSNEARCGHCEKPLSKPGVAMPRWLGMLTPWPVTCALLVYCALWFVAGIVAEGTPFFNKPDETTADALGRAFFRGANANVWLGSTLSFLVLEANQYWRWMTACFLHSGVIHLAFNVMALMNIGPLAEMIWGKRRYWTLFIATGLGGSVVSFVWRVLRPYAWDLWVTGKAEGLTLLKYCYEYEIYANSVGASGAICGLIGAMLAAWVRKRGVPDHIGKALRTNAIYMLLLGLFLHNMIDNTAHIGGGLVGFGLGWLLKPRLWTARHSAEDRAWTVAAWVCVALVAACLAAQAHFLVTEPIQD